MKNQLKLLDCTLRDGGYYNNWEFSEKLINKYLIAIDKAGIHIVELGFRNFDEKKYYGACAYTKDSFIETLKIPKSLNIAVMINASDIVNKDKKIILKYFRKKIKSKINIIRIAAHYKELGLLKNKIKILKELGYKIYLNLMQISERSSAEIKNVGKYAAINKINVLYFADSLGSLKNEEISNIIKLLKVNWNGELGIHTHDNLSRATLNTKIAQELGVNYIDCTVNGMGRGPGNAKTELLIFEYQKQIKKKIDPIPLLNLVENEFKQLKEKYNWGTNPFYYIAGLKKIHPTFIQTMLNDNRFTNDDILSTINYISTIDGTKFNRKLIYSNQNFKKKINGNWKASALLKNKNILIIGNGPSIMENKKLLEKVISQKKLFVIALNTQKNINDNLINLRVISNELRFLTDRKEINKVKQILVLPYKYLSKNLKKNIKIKKLYDFGFNIVKGIFEFHDKYAVGPNSLAISYALAIANSGKSKKIYLAGIDGYEKNDYRQVELQQTFESLNKNKNLIPYYSITTTKLNIPSISLHTLLD